MYFGRLFHVIWNAVPVELEHDSNLAGMGVHLSCNKAEVLKAHNKGLTSGEWKTAFGGRKGELLAVVGCGMNGPDRAKLVSNATRTWDKRNLL